MSNEEMQFADPEWQPPGQHSSDPEQEPFNPQPINAPPGEQPGWQSPPREESDGESDYYAGYRAQRQRGYTVPPRQQRRGRTRPWFWIILVLIILTVLSGRPFFIEGGSFVEGFVLENLVFGLLILGILVAVIALLRSRGSVTFRNTSTVETRDFLVGNRPTIIINNGIGTIRVRSSAESNQVRIRATKQSKGLMSSNTDLQVHYNQRAEDNTIIVDSMHRWSIFGKNSVDYDIIVPLIADLELKIDVGKIDVSDVIGQMRLASDAGSIHATHISLQGQSKLKTDVGSLNFSGSIDPQGTYKFLSDAGSINITLPEDASFHVDASTDSGSIRCNFPIKGQSKISHTKLKGKVGNPPYATLTLKTDVGSITLKQT
jgi:Putative adhesin